MHGVNACRYCGGPLVALGAADPRRSHPCHACHASVPETANFCQKCGSRSIREAKAPDDVQTVVCAGCGTQTERHAIAGGHPVDACRRCGGAWAPKQTLEAVIEAARARPLPPGAPPRRRVDAGGLGKVVYRRCPVCSKLMARRNFARISGIILDTCPEHGTYFDHGELPAVVDFVRGGGLEAAQRKEIEELQRETARAKAAAQATPRVTGIGAESQSTLGRATGIGLGADLVAAFVGWAVWWDR